MINPAKLMKVKNAWDTFTRNHPKFPMFLTAAQNSGIQEGTIIEITITSPEGKTISTNVKITESDAALLREMTDMVQ